jgi:hypothetical protein
MHIRCQEASGGGSSRSTTLLALDGATRSLFEIVGGRVVRLDDAEVVGSSPITATIASAGSSETGVVPGQRSRRPAAVVCFIESESSWVSST